MAFSKSFPKTSEKSSYPKWVEVYLTEEEEKNQEVVARDDHIRLMRECVDDAKRIIEDKDLNRYQSDLVQIAVAFFEKRASHEIYFKERKTKEKFDSK